MRLKSYFAGSVESAMTLAREELGPETMLVYSREAAPEARYLGKYEVVFALAEEPAAPAAPSARPAAAPSARPAEDDSGFTQVRDEIGCLRRQLKHMSGMLSRVYPNAFPDAVQEVYTALLHQDVASDLALEIAGELSGMASAESWTPELATRLLRQILDRLIRVSPELGSGPDGERRIVALVGPPGTGKTTTLAKLAVTYGLKARRPVTLIAMDTWRIAAAEQLRTYAGILGTGFAGPETIGGLALALEQVRGQGLILIDTPGYAERDMAEAGELARWFSSRPDIDIHLTLPATVRPADLARGADRYQIFHPSKLLFTRLDEAACYGALLSESVRTARPISFLAGGQQVPEDLMEASQEYLAGLLMGDRRTAEWQDATPGAVVSSTGRAEHATVSGR